MLRCKGDKEAGRSHNKRGVGSFVLRISLIAVVLLFVTQSGCKSPSGHRQEADEVAYDIVSQKQAEALGRTEGFTIVRYSDLLRYRLLEGQDLQYSSDASLGTHAVAPVEHWPDPEYLVGQKSSDAGLDPLVLLRPEGPVRITLTQALQIGARNNFEYQTNKETVFESALGLDLQRHFFRWQYSGGADGTLSRDLSLKPTETNLSHGVGVGITRNFANGLDFAASLGLDIVNLLSGGGASSMGLAADVSISMPLLRGSGKHIVTEPLTQAERDVVYAIYDFEEYKRTYAVNVASAYLGVLGSLDRIKNAEENYRRLVISVRRSRRLADAGQSTEMEVDQAVQDELNARQGWISAKENYQNSLDAFKVTLGLPVDAEIELDRGELDRLVEVTTNVLVGADVEQEQTEPNLPADAPITFKDPGWQNPGPLEIDSKDAVSFAFENRLDLRKSQGQVYDAQRDVVIKADRLRGELTIGGSTGAGVGIGSGEDARLRFNDGTWSLPLVLNLPLERTSERNEYRSSLITLEQWMRNLASLEDGIKRDVRSVLRELLATRESLQIQAKGVKVAQKRVDSTDLFLLAGRAQIRDILEAQRALLGAQNSLTSAVVSYRVAELSLQRDMGLLVVDEKGLWREFTPEDIKE